jgi:hypothetical protein
MRTTETTVTKLWKQRQAGATLTILGQKQGVSAEAIGALFKSRGLVATFETQCELPECRKRFFSKRPDRRTCCRKHNQRLLERERKGLTAALLPCALPGCTQQILWLYTGKRPNILLASGEGRRFCCKQHAAMASTRRKSGYYQRLLDRPNKCFSPQCAEHILVEEHHLEFVTGRNGGSNKTSLTCWLCPTHHMAIHRGLAVIQQGQYVDLVPSLLTDIEHKKELFANYERSLDPHRKPR